MCGDNSEAKGIVLLCDSCDAEYHLTCCTPPLEACPEGEWFCLTCRMNRGDLVADLFHEVGRFSLFIFWVAVFFCAPLCGSVRTAWEYKSVLVVLIIPDSVVPVDVYGFGL